jgi:hypothetical protein
MSTEVVHKDGSRPLKTQGSQSRLPPSGSPSRHLKTKSIDHRDEKLFADPGPDETECTFKPRINPISRSMATYLKPLHTEEGITYYLDRKKAKVQQLREKLEREQEVKCPECFEHIYNGGRSKLPENFNHKKVCTRLYVGGLEMYERREQKAQEFAKAECPFQPNTDNPRKSPHTDLKGIGEFLKRNAVDCRLRQLKLEKAMCCRKNDMDLELRDKHRIGYRHKAGGVARKNPDKIGKDLYERGIKAYNENMEKHLRSMTPKLETSKTKAANDKFVKKFMTRRFEDIFFLLDERHTGYLNSKNMNLEALHPRILKLMAEMFFEMEDYNLTLDLSQFIQACTNLYHVISLHSVSRVCRQKYDVEPPTQECYGGRRGGGPQ